MSQEIAVNRSAVSTLPSSVPELIAIRTTLLHVANAVDNAST